MATAIALIGMIVALFALRGWRRPPLPPTFEEAAWRLFEAVELGHLRDVLVRHREARIWVELPRGEVKEVDCQGLCRDVLEGEIRGGTRLRIGPEPGPPWVQAAEDELFQALERLREFQQQVESQFTDVQKLSQALQEHVGVKRSLSRVTGAAVMLVLLLILWLVLVGYYTVMAWLASQ